MGSGSFFINSHQDAVRHVATLAKGLRKGSIASLISGTGCSAVAVILSRVLLVTSKPATSTPGVQETSGVVFVAWFLALALIAYSVLYFISGWGLGHQKAWGRYVGALTFLSKVLLCVWLGRSSLAAMVIFLVVAAWDIYGLWVLLSKQTGQLFSSPEASHVSVKPANLVT